LESGRIVEGSVSDEQFEEIVREVRRAFGQTGRTENRGATREWMSSGTQLEEVRLTITPRGESTSIQLTQQYDALFLLYYLVGAGISLISITTMLSALDFSQVAELLMAAGGAGGAFAGLRFLITQFLRRQRRKLAKLMSTLESTASSESVLSQRDNRAAITSEAGRPPLIEIPDAAAYAADAEVVREASKRREDAL
jgi:hypothetical protein